MRPLIILIGLVIAVIVAAVGVQRLFRLGMQQGYAPEQQIAFSHKLHAGDNKAPCQYCDFGARSSRHTGIPLSSVCMNCHGLLEAPLRATIRSERLRQLARIWSRQLTTLTCQVGYDDHRATRLAVVTDDSRKRATIPDTSGGITECLPRKLLKGLSIRMTRLDPAHGLSTIDRP
jgi:hypothetical protein